MRVARGPIAFESYPFHLRGYSQLNYIKTFYIVLKFHYILALKLVS